VRLDRMCATTVDVDWGSRVMNFRMTSAGKAAP